MDEPDLTKTGSSGIDRKKQFSSVCHTELLRQLGGELARRREDEVVIGHAREEFQLVEELLTLRPPEDDRSGPIGSGRPCSSYRDSTSTNAYESSSTSLSTTCPTWPKRSRGNELRGRVAP